MACILASPLPRSSSMSLVAAPSVLVHHLAGLPLGCSQGFASIQDVSSFSAGLWPCQLRAHPGWGPRDALHLPKAADIQHCF